MLLGDILSEIERASLTGNAAALLDDLVLLAHVNDAAARQGIDAESYVVAAVRGFEREVSGDDWTTLISAMTAGSNPGSICIKRMFEWAAAKDNARLSR